MCLAQACSSVTPATPQQRTMFHRAFRLCYLLTSLVLLKLYTDLIWSFSTLPQQDLGRCGRVRTVGRGSIPELRASGLCGSGRRIHSSGHDERLCLNFSLAYQCFIRTCIYGFHVISSILYLLEKTKSQVEKKSLEEQRLGDHIGRHLPYSRTCIRE